MADQYIWELDEVTSLDPADVLAVGTGVGVSPETDYITYASLIAQVETDLLSGSDTYVQFNDGGAFGSDSGLVYNKTIDKLKLGGNLESKFPLDQPLTETTESNHFDGNLSTYPTEWTEVDAPVITDTNSQIGFWHIRGSSTDTSWDYKRQTAVSIEGLSANQYASFRWGPIIFKDGGYTADLDYYFGIYADNSGSPSTTKFSRVNLHWNSGSAIWQIRGECKDGTTQTNSTYKTLSFPYVPMYFRTLIRNGATATMIEYGGANMFTRTLTQLQSVAGTVTWGSVWQRLHMSRGAGTTDDIYLGALDYEGNIA